ncbi:MAG: ATP-binding protein, partial [Anaerolineae bacterium]|nr:ATP-binding protein [Anaerolineae bacterium]
WGIEFPEVFYNADGTVKAEPGFTIIFGNPPWEILKPDLREFYAQFDERIESKYSRAQAEQRIAELDGEEPRRRADFEALNASVGQTTTFLRGSPDYTRQGRGDPATHKLFLERMYSLLGQDGRLGYVIPSGIYTDLGTKDLREMLLNEGSIEHLFSFSNERFFFPSVDHRFKFCLLGARKGTQSEGFWATFRFNPRVAVAPTELHSFLANPENLVYMRRESLTRFSPDSLSLMEFQTRRDYAIAEQIYDGWPLVGDDSAALPWRIKFTREFDMTNDRDIFNTSKQGWALYEGKMIHQYDAFYGEPIYWVDTSRGIERFGQNRNQSPTDYRFARLAFRAIANSTNERTLISCIIPGNVFCGHSMYTQVGNNLKPDVQLYVQGVLNSLTLDSIVRLRVTSNVSLFMLYQLPLPRLVAGNRYFDAIVPRAARLTCTRREFAGLWEAVMGGAWDAANAAVDPGERQRLRDEIDGLVAHLYGLSREDYGHILSSFPLVFPETAAGQARRAAALAAYDKVGIRD